MNCSLSMLTLTGWAGGLLRLLPHLFSLLALFFLSLSAILLFRIRRNNYNETQTMRIAREWRQQLLRSVYSSPPSRRSDEALLPRKPEPAARRTRNWARIWSRVCAVSRTLSRTIAARWTKRGPSSTTKGFARPLGAVILAAFALSWAALAYMDVKNHEEIAALKAQLARYDSSTVIEHHVLITSQLDGGDFAYVSDEKPGGDTFRPCAADAANGVDAIGILRQSIGYAADHVIWEERGTCRSILRADLGFFWRDVSNKFIYQRGN
jgi:hypothetical protein